MEKKGGNLPVGCVGMRGNISKMFSSVLPTMFCFSLGILVTSVCNYKKITASRYIVLFLSGHISPFYDDPFSPAKEHFWLISM